MCVQQKSRFSWFRKPQFYGIAVVREGKGKGRGRDGGREGEGKGKGFFFFLLDEVS